ncbi:hypothetical protein CSUI_008562, partial [Cystoisospora suis]
AEVESSEDTEKLLQLQIDELEKEKKKLEEILAKRRDEIRQSFGVLIDAAKSEVQLIKVWLACMQILILCFLLYSPAFLSSSTCLYVKCASTDVHRK